MLVLLMGEIYELGRCDGNRFRDMHTMFQKVRLRHSKVNREGYTCRQTDSKVIS
jgi:hypothetical protein